MTHYEVLGVNELAGGAKIKRHYYELCKKYHPDVSGGDSQKMVAVNEAYRVLSDTTLKSAYDRELAAQRREDAFARAAQTAATHQTAWQDVATQPTAQGPAAFTRAAKAPTKKKSGWAWFMAFGSAAAMIIIAVSYVMPVPKAASATTDTPTVATNDVPAETTQTSTNTSANTASDKAAQDALNTLQSDTTPPANTTPTTPAPTDTTSSSSSSSSSASSQTTHKHRRPFSFWYTQSND